MARPALLLIAAALSLHAADAPGVQVDPGGPVLNRPTMPYPEGLESRGIQGTVVLELSLDKNGEVTALELVSGPPELGRVAMRSAIDWKYSSEIALPGKVHATITFTHVAVRRIRVGSGVQAYKLLTATPPVMPPLARQARISGVVRLNAIIGSDGCVKNLTVASGHPLLVPAALEAVRTWTYRPTLLNGDPVEVVTQIDVNMSAEEPGVVVPPPSAPTPQ